eukprot:TRINITY_DN9890_c0_g1_i1.p1 TRINITY_DN9890_c0_g1~~TRINITY_DN9890_c0_g1_i1.p1  ORF type:complete len:745 (-),score=276.19 TRINITY_DN9890_c0_g1_i1:208-2442(-)
MDAIPGTNEADREMFYGVLWTFAKWMNVITGKTEATNMKHLKSLVVLHAEYGKSFLGMASDEFAELIKKDDKPEKKEKNLRMTVTDLFRKWWSDEGKPLFETNGPWAEEKKLRNPLLWEWTGAVLPAPGPIPSPAGKTAVKEEPREVAVKKEVKEEIKEEVKKEVKDEPADGSAAAATDEAGNGVKQEEDADMGQDEVKEEDDDDFMNTLMPVDEPQKGRKRKREEEVHDLPELDENELTVETDTEYETPDLSGMPQKLCIQDSGLSKIDATYQLCKKPSRGKPAWYSLNNKKRTFLYWNKMWRIGMDYGSSNSFAKVLDVKGVMCPTEPYPNIWKVLDKNASTEGSSSFAPAASMRVFDAASADEEKKILEGLTLPLLKEEVTLTSEAKEAKDERKKKKNDAKKAKEAAKEEAAKSEQIDTIEQSLEKEIPCLGCDLKLKPFKKFCEECGCKRPLPEDLKKATCKKCKFVNKKDNKECSKCGTSMAEAAPQPAAVSSDSDDSSSETSSSESEDDKATAAEKESQEQAKKAQQFKARVTSQMDQRKGRPVEMAKKLQTMRQHFKKDPDNLSKMSCMPVEELSAFLDKVEEEYKSHMQMPTASKRPSKDSKGTPAPATPPDDPEPTGGSGGGDKAIIAVQPGKGCLKASHRFHGRQRRRPEDAFHGHQVEKQYLVDSLRSAGEALWFQQPGAMVKCDHCGLEVAQAQGRLQGAEGKSQFAQCEFVCGSCASGNGGFNNGFGNTWQ